jgi:UDP-N-acetylmuramoyl-L-alanyl-D-glutamate--2,6-diaminopimelate ligase
MMAAAVAAMSLGQLLGPAAGSKANLVVTDLISDSREVTAGSAFVALGGERSHGLDYAMRALQAGAVIVIHDTAQTPDREIAPSLGVPNLEARVGELGRRFYGDRQPSGELIGVTGTNGKTTVAWLTAQALTSLNRSCGYLGTLGFGATDALTPHALTTPDCLTLHRELAGLGTDHAAIEVSSHALAQNRLAGLKVTIAAFTNLSRDHLDWHASMESYFDAKASLFERPGLEAAVVNADDAYAAALLGRIAAPTPVLRVGLKTPSDITARVVRRELSGLAIEVSGLGHGRIESALIGDFNAENLLLALGILVTTGCDFDAACAALGAASPPPGRLEVFGGPPANPWVIVDYAHTPAALERVLAELTALTNGGITCVFGCGGDRDRGKRALMGEVAARYAAHIVLTDDNPRSEEPGAIVADIKSGIARHPDLRIEHARERAIGDAIAARAPGEIVLVAGKGHETVQTIGATTAALDDRVIVRRALEGVT